jgi:hypothetical protein
MEMGAKQPGTIKIFYCYAHEDKALRNELERHLGALKRLGYITGWTDCEIQAGGEWESEIETHLNTSQIILLLISSDFLASNYCYGVEMRRALERHATREARVIPIILRPVDWKGTPFEKLRALPTNGRPVTKWTNRDDAFTDIAKGIRKAVEELQGSRPIASSSPANTSITVKTNFPLWPPTIPNERYYLLPGREQGLNQLLTALQDPQGPLMVAIDGLGGLGKTAMAVELVRRTAEQGWFEGVIGDSAQQELFAGEEIIHVREATLDLNLLLDSVARQLGHWELPALRVDEKHAILASLLQQHSYLILVDNLETIDNANTLVAQLRGFLGRSRAVITTRKKVRHDFVLSLSLQGLGLEDSLLFLQRDVELRKVQQIQNASREKLIEIYHITGGAPLAMRLVIAQALFLDLSIILKRLQQAGSSLYSFIFRQSWEHLSPTAQKILIYIGRTVVTTVRWEELASIHIAESEEKLIQAIDQLVAYSLLDISSTMNQTRYGVHQLTRQFVNGDLPEMWKQQGLQ